MPEVAERGVDEITGTTDILDVLLAVLSQRFREESQREDIGLQQREIALGIFTLAQDPRYQERLKWIDERSLNDYLFQNGVWGRLNMVAVPGRGYLTYMPKDISVKTIEDMEQKSPKLLAEIINMASDFEDCLKVSA